MPTGVHELFLARVEDAIRSQLNQFAAEIVRQRPSHGKVWPALSIKTCFSVENAPSNSKSKYEPDASFWHNAQYPRVIIEVAYSQKKRRERHKDGVTFSMN